MGRVFLICLCLLVTGVARAQDWSSSDVGSVGVAGSADDSAGTWTIRGSGADIWGVDDAFQFVHRAADRSGSVIARITNLQAANSYAKAGVMVRASLDADAATAILDVKPDGGLEFMARASSGQPMQYLDGATTTGATWLRLIWSAGTVTASTSVDGQQWTVLCSTNVALPLSPQTGVVVTSHDNGALATATLDNVSVGIQRATWQPQAIGGASGTAVEQNGIWTITATGADIWSDADSFEFLSRRVSGSNLHAVVRIDDLQNTNPFAKAGIMLRASADPSAATALLDVTPGGQIEFMARSASSSAMAYLGGATVTTPVWLQLSWSPASSASTDIVASISADGVTWTPVGPHVALSLPDAYLAGAAVTSHDTTHATTAHLEGLTLLPNGWGSTDIGAASMIGNATIDTLSDDVVFTVEGAGSDIWGTADAFHLVQLPTPLPDHFSLTYRVVSLDDTNTMAKAGMMFRDGTDASAPSVVLDAKPDGGVEFMARLCGGCGTTFIGSARIAFPAFLSLIRDGATFTATVFTIDPGDGSTVGSVTVPMTTPIAGFAVTSHDASRTTTALFDEPAR